MGERKPPAYSLRTKSFAIPLIICNFVRKEVLKKLRKVFREITADEHADSQAVTKAHESGGKVTALGRSHEAACLDPEEYVESGRRMMRGTGEPTQHLLIIGWHTQETFFPCVDPTP